MKLSDWIKIPLEDRRKIAAALEIKQTSPVHVFNNEVVQDGYSIAAVESIDEKEVKKLLNNETLHENKETKQDEGGDLSGDVPEKADKPKKKAVRGNKKSV